MPRLDRQFWDPHATATRVRAHFHGEHEATYNGNVDGYRPGFGSIVGFQFRKQIGQASGTWSITAKRPDSMTDRDFSKAWRDAEGTWVEIDWICDGEVIAGCLGNIDTVGMTETTSQTGARARTFTITGRDHGKVFENTTMFVNMHQTGAGGSAHVATFRAQTEALTGTPAFIVRGLIETWLANNYLEIQPWRMPAAFGGRGFADILVNRFDPMDKATDGEAFAAALRTSDQSGAPLWSTMSEWSNPVLNELFCDLVPPSADSSLAAWSPGIYLRRRPFATRQDARRWTSLRTRTLEPGDFKDIPMSKGGAAQRFNYWQLHLDQYAGSDGLAAYGVDGIPTGQPGSTLIFSEESIERHGMRRYVASTKYLQTLSGSSAGVQRALAAWLRVLHDWYVVAPLQESGTITCTRVFPEIHVGERLRVERSSGAQFFYVEGVEHTWEAAGPGVSRLTVTRGEWEGDNLLDYAYQNYGVEAPGPRSNIDSCDWLAAFLERPRDQVCREVVVSEAGPTDITGGTADAITDDSQIVSDTADGLVTEGVDGGMDFTLEEADAAAADADGMTFTLEEADDASAAAGAEYDASGGATEDPSSVVDENGAPTEAEPTPTNVERGRPVRVDPLSGLDTETGLPNDPANRAFLATWGID